MYRLIGRSLCMLAFCLLVAGAAGTLTSKGASAQTIYNPYATVTLPTVSTTSGYMPVSYSSFGTYASDSIPFSANGTTITGPDNCWLYDSWCAYCTDHSNPENCVSYPPVPRPTAH